MTAFLLTIFCFFFPANPSCTAKPTTSTTTASQPTPYIAPTPVTTYKNLASFNLTPGNHTFKIQISNSKPSVGYQLLLKVDGPVTSLSTTQTTISGLTNLMSKVSGNELRLYSLIDNPLNAWKPSRATSVAEVNLTTTAAGSVTFQIASRSNITEYNKESPVITNLLESGSASVTITKVQ